MASGGTNVSNAITAEQLKSAPNYFVDMYNMVGTTEYLPGNKNKDNPVVKDMFNTIKYPGSPRKVPWCAIGLCHFLEKRGWISPKKANARSFQEWGTKVTTPRRGDVVVLWRGSYDDGWSGHVTLFVRETAKYIYGLGCNQGDSITIARFPKRKLLGYYRPRNVPVVSKTIISGAGSAATGTAAEVVKQIDTVTPTIPVPKPPIDASIEAAKNTVEAMQPLGSVLSTIAIILTVLSVGLALLTIWWRYRDYKETGL